MTQRVISQLEAGRMSDHSQMKLLNVTQLLKCVFFVCVCVRGAGHM